MPKRGSDGGGGSMEFGQSYSAMLWPQGDHHRHILAKVGGPTKCRDKVEFKFFAICLLSPRV